MFSQSTADATTIAEQLSTICSYQRALFWPQTALSGQQMTEHSPSPIIKPHLQRCGAAPLLFYFVLYATTVSDLKPFYIHELSSHLVYV